MIRPRRYLCFLLTACAAIVPVGCKPSAERPHNVLPQIGDTAMNLTIQSPAFDNNMVIPQRFTADGADISPELRWALR